MIMLFSIVFKGGRLFKQISSKVGKIILSVVSSDISCIPSSVLTFPKANIPNTFSSYLFHDLGLERIGA